MRGLYRVAAVQGERHAGAHDLGVIVAVILAIIPFLLVRARALALSADLAVMNSL
jgi:heme/copper-type cytochrome/quinol oxidase subunit 4